jgi:hypothetical protein
MQIRIPAMVPAVKHQVLRDTVHSLADIEGIVAIVLGGSYARGTHHEHSDVDLGVYYTDTAPFSLAAIRHVAQKYSDGTPPVVTDFYEWGPWVNGGAWIKTTVGKVDFLYRSIEHVERTIQEAQQGIHHHHYGQQPAFGFYSVTYLAETQMCVPLFDPHATLTRLKREVAVYPPALYRALVADMLWAAEFSFLFARKFAADGDVYNTGGCLTRIAGSLTQALYALNETYFMSDKGALAAVAQFPRRPSAYGEHVTEVLAHPGSTPTQLEQAVNKLYALWQDMVDLAGTLYMPKYPLR